MKDKKLKDKKLEKERLKKKCNPKLEIELIQLFKRNAVDGKFLSYNDIMKKLRIKKSYLAELIKPLEEMSFLEIKFVNYSSKKEERKLYKLNKRGLWHADKLEAPSLRTDELKTLHLHNRIRKQADSKIKKDFLTLLDLFKEFGFNEAALDFSELIRNFLEQVRKCFLNETQFNQTMELLESPAQHD